MTRILYSTLLVLCLSINGGYAADENYPEPPTPMKPSEAQLKTKAGYGSGVSYARAGVLELGGSLSYVTANNFEQVSVSPSVGWFFADNFQISGMLSLNKVSQGSNDATYWTLLAEPSYHMPFSNRIFGFLGLGAGIAHSDQAGSGVAIQPRVGANILIGRSGVLTPSFFVAYNAIESQPVGNGVDLLSVDQIAGLNVSYTIIW